MIISYLKAHENVPEELLREANFAETSVSARSFHVDQSY